MTHSHHRADATRGYRSTMTDDILKVMRESGREMTTVAVLDALGGKYKRWTTAQQISSRLKELTSRGLLESREERTLGNTHLYRIAEEYR